MGAVDLGTAISVVILISNVNRLLTLREFNFQLTALNTGLGPDRFRPGGIRE